MEFCACIPADGRRLLPPTGEGEYFSTRDETALKALVWVSADFESVVLDQDDGLEGGAAFVGQLVERLLLGPAPLQQRAAHHAGRVDEAGAEAQGHV